MTILKNRFLYVKVWSRGVYLAIGNHPFFYVLRLWVSFPRGEQL